jgi:hypothetical protein
MELAHYLAVSAFAVVLTYSFIKVFYFKAERSGKYKVVSKMTGHIFYTSDCLGKAQKKVLEYSSIYPQDFIDIEWK